MIQDKTHMGAGAMVIGRVKDYVMFAKLRLSSLVVFSAVIGYALGADTFMWPVAIRLMAGGFLITAASNGFNQIIEKDLDKLMSRTQNRPLPSGRMSLAEAYILAFGMGIAGAFLLFEINMLSGWMGVWALLLYALLYTPLKRVTTWGVFVGGFPGAVPPMLGYVAATGEFGLVPGVLFFIQFIWQFPHFWAIAWKLHDDYNKAGFKMLPSGKKDKRTAFLIFIYTIFMIPTSLLPVLLGITGPLSAGICLVAGLWFMTTALKLYVSLKDEDATKVMFASFIYLPIILLSYLIDQL